MHLGLLRPRRLGFGISKAPGRCDVMLPSMAAMAVIESPILPLEPGDEEAMRQISSKR